MSIYDASSITHPIPEYQTSKHGIIYINIICKYKKKKKKRRNGGTAAKSKKFPLWLCAVCLQTAITSSFQIQIAHRLKKWTPDFLSFKKKYGMHNLSSIKYSKNLLITRLLVAWHVRVSTKFIPKVLTLK